MTLPAHWTEEQLEEQRLAAIEIFRRRRMEEPLEQYIANFDEYQGVIEELLESTLDLSDIDSRLVDVLTAPKLLEAFRYLAGPPISDDDLKVVAEAVLSRQRILRDPEMVGRIKQVVLSGLDRRRFPWVIEGREPTESEREAAIVASAALIATRRLETRRRSDGKREQEASVHAALREMGFTQVASRKVSVLSDAPAPGEFCAESDLGGRKADVLVGLWDRRVMPIECKVSNSSTNSVKRLNNDAAVKAETWRKDFGQLQMVPSAVLGGVYKLHNLQDAQRRGLSLFWAHDLNSLTNWISSTKR
ncbi:TPA: XamI family restriction endonuclease [Pseudomonas aeruginosa]|uniref:XamI family restriction endonuclease n=5 Tax=Pseudomonadota TaxID=1224 RepID=A0A8I1E7S1_9PSED|nr:MULTISPECIES: XamI family restriction endonuclease [Pseudomonas]MBA4894559.1 XamI family restriction endonuclease [Pseudomonas aeruginosa]MBI6550868.1 XamI family restriction endonuclease [Pseudomonas veronii]MBI6599499.1 XamI family restriction endonuclease [Pseudomonas sp. S4_EA_1b]MBI6626656.1 XamI family restriction endonuclease [Pseudomonas rhodesiae]MBI6651023.1 XamI family restriction endonuclease [Pseudomonas veronii]